MVSDALAGEGLAALEPDRVVDALGSSGEGLSATEVAARLQQFGRNEIAAQRSRSQTLELLAQFASPMAILMWVAGGIAVLAGLLELGLAVFAVVVINGVFGYWQEYRAERATEALRRMLAQRALVLRDGAETEVPTEELVPGDLLLLTEGERIGADARLIECSDLRVDQSTLTGESRSVHKSPAAIHGRRQAPLLANMVFAGTSVVSGDGRGVVTSTGMDTEFGRIAHLTQSVPDVASPLQQELGRLTRELSVLALAMGALYFVVAVLFVGQPGVTAFVFALAMIVAFIPEGLLPTVTLSLAMAVQRMAQRNALVKKLSSVETLGCTTVICSDKTGTLTQNEMTVTRIWLPGETYEVEGRGYAPAGVILRAGVPQRAATNPALRELLEGVVLCNNAALLEPAPGEDEWGVRGDQTEACLLVAATKAGVAPAELRSRRPRLRELPFDSHRQRMTTVHAVDGTPTAYLKGAPQQVTRLCTRISRGGVDTALSDTDVSEITAATDGLARQGLRVLAVARRTLEDATAPAGYTVAAVEGGLTFLGLVAMEDPPREGVTEAVATCHRAHIRVIMMTGDYGLTAEAIARSIGIVRGDDARVISGSDLEAMSDRELAAALHTEAIFARVAPEQKYRVVAALQRLGDIVAVTGDGVNDAPALKKADIGIAMGRAGTDVSKEAADMILTDDHFASIVEAIREGRGVYDNIRRFLIYILTSNVAEAAPATAFLVSGGLIPLPLTVMQILTIDLGTDLLPALGLGTEPPEGDVMDRAPRSRAARLMNRHVLALAFAWYGLLEALFGLAGYFVVNLLNGWPTAALAASGGLYQRATTMTLGAIIFSQIGAVLNCRTTRASVVRVGLLGNRRVVLGIVVEVLLLGLLSYLGPLQHVFGTAPLRVGDWAFLAVLPVLMVALGEARKAVGRRRGRR